MPFLLKYSLYSNDHIFYSDKNFKLWYLFRMCHIAVTMIWNNGYETWPLSRKDRIADEHRKKNQVQRAIYSAASKHGFVVI